MGANDKTDRTQGVALMSNDQTTPQPISPDDPWRLVLCDLPARAANVLASAGARTIGDVTAMSARQLSRTKNCGGVTLNAIVTALAGRGLSLTPDDQSPRRPPRYGWAYVVACAVCGHKATIEPEYGPTDGDGITRIKHAPDMPVGVHACDANRIGRKYIIGVTRVRVDDQWR